MFRLGTDNRNAYEYSINYLTRNKRMLFLRGLITGFPGGVRDYGRDDSYSPTVVADDIMAMSLEDPTKPIMLFIDSIGGEVSTGMALFDVIKFSKAPVITVGVNCASMATIVLMAGKKRLITPHSKFMMHLPIMNNVSGDTTDFALKSKELNKIKDELVECYIDHGVNAGLVGADKTKIRKQIHKDIDREFWLTAPEALKYGLADGIITSDEMFGDINLD